MTIEQSGQDDTDADVAVKSMVEPIDETSGGPPMVDAAAERRAARREKRRLLFRRPSFIVGLVIFGFWVLCAILQDAITPGEAFNIGTAPLAAPSTDALFGTDILGRDILSRVMLGSRDVLVSSIVAAFLGVMGGTILGLIMGYFGGLVDDILGRIVEVFLAIPVVLGALFITGLFGKGSAIVILTVAGLFAPVVARTIRAAVMNEARLDYVTSSQLRGEGSIFIMGREILPNVTGPIIVEFTVRVGYAIFTISTLSFVGAGIQPPSPDWGLQIRDGIRVAAQGDWWLTLFPALAIMSLVIAVNLIADSIESVNKA